MYAEEPRMAQFFWRLAIGIWSGFLRSIICNLSKKKKVMNAKITIILNFIYLSLNEASIYLL